jgi:hypothetical protein
MSDIDEKFDQWVHDMNEVRNDVDMEQTNYGRFFGDREGLTIRVRNAKVLVVLVFDDLSSPSHEKVAKELHLLTASTTQVLIFKVDPKDSPQLVADYIVDALPHVVYVKYDKAAGLVMLDWNNDATAVGIKRKIDDYIF